jgi:hypothetical protein
LLLVVQVLHRCQQVVLHHSKAGCHTPTLLQQGHLPQHCALESDDATDLHTHNMQG